MGIAVFLDAIFISTLVLQGVWAVRLRKLSLTRRYPVLFLYLWSSSLLGAIAYGLLASRLQIFGQPGYMVFWVGTRPFVWALLFLLIFEVYSFVLEDYRGLRRLGQLVLYGAVTGVAVLIGLLAYLDNFEGPALSRWHKFWLIVDRDVYLAIVAVVFLLMMFKKLFGLKTPKNVQLVFTSFGLYFAGVAVFTILRAYLGPSFTAASNVGSILLYALCLALGATMFSHLGEAKPARKFSTSQYLATARGASRQLESLNQRLAEILS